MGIWDDPNVLVVHLKRFNASPFSLGGKVGRHVKFGPFLDLKPYSARHLQLERPEQGGISGAPPSKARCVLCSSDYLWRHGTCITYCVNAEDRCLCCPIIYPIPHAHISHSPPSLTLPPPDIT